MQCTMDLILNKVFERMLIIMVINKFIGVSLGNNTSASVIDVNNGIELAISEERLNGEKNTKQFPIKALRGCIARVLAGVDVSDIYIGISSYEVINWRTTKYMDQDLGPLEEDYDDFYGYLNDYIHEVCDVPEYVNLHIERTEHHRAHMLPAIYLSGYKLLPEKLIAITADGFGDGTSATITDHDSRETLAKATIGQSLGLIYQFVTGALGYKEHQHEGKITGLAALGRPLFKNYFFNKILDYDATNNRFVERYKDAHGSQNLFIVTHNENIQGFVDLLKMKNMIYKMVNELKMSLNAKDEDIAASLQEYVETMICKWIEVVLSNNNIKGNFNIVLSGGLFTNVKVNYRIKEQIKPTNLFVLPPMGDEGTSIGSALDMAIKQRGEGAINLKEFGKDDLYYGKITGYGNHLATVRDLLPKNEYTVVDFVPESAMYLANDIANLLAQGKIVCISRGQSEFGPRALCNHSILYDASLKSTNDSLNTKLSRTEFMPFAPVALEEFGPHLFKGIEGLEKTLKYMTIAVPVTKEFEDNYKAAYHVDKTARPQLVSKEDNEFMHTILERYYDYTGKKALINTSFNLHNHPIIFDDITAINSFLSADLDVLVLNNKLIVKRGL